MQRGVTKTKFPIVVLGALGVVYGDIGTSPLYAFRECLNAHHLAPTPENVFGILSLVFWSLFLIITVKYLGIVLRADNNGEGGILALLALLQPEKKIQSERFRHYFVLTGLFGAALL